jgi:predicted DNA binding CopG/RHH family protein
MSKTTDFDYELDDYEKEIEDSLELGGFKHDPDFAKQKLKLEAAARATLEKTKNINIRISLGDLFKVKSLAAEQGIPYQTLISSLIHQYSRGSIEYNILWELRAPYITSSPKPKKPSRKKHP